MAGADATHVLSDAALVRVEGVTAVVRSTQQSPPAESRGLTQRNGSTARSGPPPIHCEQDRTTVAFIQVIALFYIGIFPKFLTINRRLGNWLRISCSAPRRPAPVFRATLPTR